MPHLLRAAIDFVYPPYCPACGERAATDRGTVALCGQCLDGFRPPRDDWCDRCGAPTGPFLDSTNGCAHCSRDKFRFAGVRALGAYEGRLRSACQIGKEPHGASLPAALAGLLANVHVEWLARVDAEVLVPVPRHWTRRWWSDHDAAEIVARTLARRLGRPLSTTSLVKRKRTPPQSTLTATERKKSLVGAFAVVEGRPIAGRRVLLVDDVLTTGTTANRCARALRDAGADSVHVAVLARGIGV